MSSDFLGMSDADFMDSAPVNEEVAEEVHEEEELVEQAEDIQDAPTDEESVEEAKEEEEEESDGDEPSATHEVEEEDYKRILQPFKANGGEVKVRNVDEAIQLMQMGANYTKKMQALQPNLKVLKTLEKQGLLDEAKLNYLIDLSKGDPKAVAKLVKEANPEWSQVDEEEEYIPTNHQVSETAIQLEQVLDNIESTPTGARCIDVVGNQWDDGSKAILTKEPALIAQLNEQMQAGIFDKINKEVQHVRMFGGLVGKSDFEAYRIVGAQMYQEGKLTQPQQQPVARTASKQQDPARNTQRKAAATPSSRKQVSVQSEYSPLAMSDEEFLKINNIHI